MARLGAASAPKSEADLTCAHCFDALRSGPSLALRCGHLCHRACALAALEAAEPPAKKQRASQVRAAHLLLKTTSSRNPVSRRTNESIRLAPADARKELEGYRAEILSSEDPHKAFPGDRPSLSLLFDAVTPRSMGSLLALYEHRVAVQGWVWGINSFDQWGVQLGKVLAKEVGKGLVAKSTQGFNASTAALIAAYMEQ